MASSTYVDYERGFENELNNTRSAHGYADNINDVKEKIEHVRAFFLLASSARKLSADRQRQTGDQEPSICFQTDFELLDSVVKRHGKDKNEHLWTMVQERKSIL